MAKRKTDGFGNYIADAEDRDLILGSLPPIRGTWYFVDPKDGLAANDGLSPGSAKANVKEAYDLCSDGAGDGIVLFSAGTAAADTTSYLSAVLDWAKDGITVYGVSSGARMFGRAVISNTSTVLNLANLITVSGDNNAFYNVHVINLGTNVAAVGAVKVTGDKNYFNNCHFVGAGHATPGAATGVFDVFLDTADGNTFEKCVFGTDAIARGANGNIVFDNGAVRNAFYDCDIICSTTTAGKGAINSLAADAIYGVQIFSRCRFIAWKEGGLGTLTSAFIGTKPTNGNILIDSCAIAGWAAWDSVGANDVVYIANSDATASGAGGIATAP